MHHCKDCIGQLLLDYVIVTADPQISDLSQVYSSLSYLSFAG